VIVDVMYSHPLLELASQEERHFAFVAERLHDRIRVHLPDCVDEIIGESSSDLEQIVKDEKEAVLQRQHLANGPDDPIGPSFDETDFEYGATDSGSLVDEQAQDHEDDSGQDMGQDHRPAVGAVAEAIIEKMCSSASLDVAPGHQGLFRFIAERLGDQIRPHLAELVTETCENFGDDITEIIAEDEQIEAPRPPPEPLAIARAGLEEERNADKILSLKHRLGAFLTQALIDFSYEKVAESEHRSTWQLYMRFFLES
jgi:hypothetical protein